MTTSFEEFVYRAYHLSIKIRFSDVFYEDFVNYNTSAVSSRRISKVLVGRILLCGIFTRGDVTPSAILRSLREEEMQDVRGY